MKRRRRGTALLSIVLLASGMAAGCTGGPEPVPSDGQAVRPARGEHVARQWRSAKPLRWQIQLTGEPDLGLDVDVFALDAFAVGSGDIARLHAAGKRVICYLNAGVHEPARPDAARFPEVTRGASTGRDGQRWLDIRRWDLLGPVLADRFTLCRDKGFDAVDADNVDGHLRQTGFPLTAEDQLTFNRRLAALARDQGLAIGLKNDLEQAVALEPDFDFAITERCFQQSTCDRLEPFVAAGKPVFHVEYETDPALFCPAARERGFVSVRKRAGLDAWLISC